MTLLLNDLDTTPYIPACSHQYTNVVIESTKHVQQAIQILLRALESRSLTLSKCANPDAAIRDASLIQLLQSSSAAGYLCEGDTYAQLGQQKMALAAYHKGLEAVTNDDPYYHRLVHGKAIADSAMNKRIDFLSQLPEDIVTNSIAPMLMGDLEMTLNDMPCNYMQVSQTWHERILRSNCIHLILQPKGGTSISDLSGSRQHERLKMIAPYVKSLSVVTTRSGSSYDYGDIHHVEFGSLRQLYINGKYIGSNMRLEEQEQTLTLIIGRSNIASPCSTIQSIGSSSVLTHLEIIPHHTYGQKDGSMTMQLSQILALCPKLISLALNHCETDLTVLGSDQQYPGMKRLLLRYTATPITDEGMIDILRRVPSLQHLTAHPCSSLRPLSTLHQHCPSLKSLKYGTDQSVPYFFESYRGYQYVFQIWDERDVHAAPRISSLLSYLLSGFQ